MLSSSESLTKSEDLLQLWLHESQRVYRDKLLDQEDLEKFDKILSDVLKRNTVRNIWNIKCSNYLIDIIKFTVLFAIIIHNSLDIYLLQIPC